MENEEVHLNQLAAIIQLVEKGEITGKDKALEKFKSYLETVSHTGPFDPAHWGNDWRREILRFGECLKSQVPNQFLNIVDERLTSSSSSAREVMEFIKSGIDINFLPSAECKKRFVKLTQDFPFNPEFRYLLGVALVCEDDFVPALNEYKLALNIEPGNPAFLEARLTTELKYLDRLIEGSELETAETHIRNLVSERNFTSRGEIRSTLTDYSRRVQDYRIFQKKVKDLEVEFREKMHAELDHERRRLIEIFGFFAAIVAFLLSTVSIGENFSFVEALYFLIALGIILILFVTSVFTVFSTERIRLVKDTKFWILVAGLVLLLFLILKADSVSKIIEQLINKQ